MIMEICFLLDAINVEIGKIILFWLIIISTFSLSKNGLGRAMEAMKEAKTAWWVVKSFATGAASVDLDPRCKVVSWVCHLCSKVSFIATIFWTNPLGFLEFYYHHSREWGLRWWNGRWIVVRTKLASLRLIKFLYITALRFEKINLQDSIVDAWFYHFSGWFMWKI